MKSLYRTRGEEIDGTRLGQVLTVVEEGSTLSDGISLSRYPTRPKDYPEKVKILKH